MNIFLVIISGIIFFVHNLHFTTSQNTELSENNTSRYFYSIGNFSCNGTPEANVTVKLYQKNETLMGIKVLNSTKTNNTGIFEISGHWKNYTLFIELFGYVFLLKKQKILQNSCNGTPEANVTVKLYQKNETLMDIEVLNSTKTNNTGIFEIFGHWKNYTLFSNYMSFTHKCNVSDKEKCSRTFWLRFPPEKAKNTSDEAKNDPFKTDININSTTEAFTNFGNETCVNGTDNELPTV
uniref:Uncharacterized protein n=1 Tax=Strongyloides papillosus TaxID=174720 RepID=A0A0N5B2Q9_STREA